MADAVEISRAEISVVLDDTMPDGISVVSNSQVIEVAVFGSTISNAELNADASGDGIAIVGGEIRLDIDSLTRAV